MIGFLKKIGSKAAGFLGFGGLFGYLLQGYAQVRVFNAVENSGESVKNGVGAYFHNLVEQNPLISAFFTIGLVTLMGTIMILFFYKLFGLNMPRRIKRYVMITPFITLFCAIVYLGYIQHLKSNDQVYTLFRDAKTQEDVLTARIQGKFSHQSEASMDPDYIFNQVGKNLHKAFYEDLVNQLSYNDLNKRRFMEISFRGGCLQTYKVQLTPLLYAAYIGNKEAVAAFVESSKIDQQAKIITKDKKNGESFGSWLLGGKYEYKAYHTPFSIAHNKKFTDVCRILQKAAEKAGYSRYRGWSVADKNNVEYFA